VVSQIAAIQQEKRRQAPAAVFLAKHREGLEIDNPEADDCLSL
jgi:hypothetical protein